MSLNKKHLLLALTLALAPVPAFAQTESTDTSTTSTDTTGTDTTSTDTTGTDTTSTDAAATDAAASTGTDTTVQTTNNNDNGFDWGWLGLLGLLGLGGLSGRRETVAPARTEVRLGGPTDGPRPS